MRHDEPIGPKSPLYLQLRELIRSKIENGEYLPGTAIPSVGALAETYGIHRLSVRSAISALIGEGLLKSVQGKGIFVVGEKLAQDLETAGGFEQTLKESAQRSETRLLIKAARPAGTLYAGRLGCPPEEPLFYVKRLYLLDGEPLSLEEAYVPQDLVPNLPDVDLNVFTLHQVYAFYGIRLARGEQSLSISRLDAAEASSSSSLWATQAAVSSISCIRPRAPRRLSAWGSKLDSQRMTAETSAGSSPCACA